MANWRGFSDCMLHCRRLMLKTWSNCSNPAAGYHHSTTGGVGGGGGLLYPVRSSEYFLRLGGRSVGVFKNAAPSSSIHRRFSSSVQARTTDGVVVVDEEEARGPLTLRSAPCLMLPGGSRLVAEVNGERYNLVTMDANDDSKYFHRFFSIREKKVVKMESNLMLPWQRELLPPDEAICFGSSRGWLAFIHPRNCSLYLFNPFINSYLPYLPLPPIQTLPSIVSTVRYNANTNPSSSSTSFSSPIVTEFTIWDQFAPISSEELSKAPFFKKIALSSSPSPFPPNHHIHRNQNIDGLNELNKKSTRSSSDCTVMVIQGYKENKLAFCRIGDKSWTALDGSATSYHDLIYFSKNQTFYAFSDSYKLIEAWDFRPHSFLQAPRKSIVISHFPPWVHPTMDAHQSRLRRLWSPDRYLVESSGELLMVVRYYSYQDPTGPKKTLLFDVYKLDFVNMDWVLLPSLGDRALFIGLNESVSVSAADFPGLALNCIYFTSPDAETLRDSHDLGVFNLEDNSITPIYHYHLDIQMPSLWSVPLSTCSEGY